MKKIVKGLAYALLAVLIVGTITGFVQRDRLKRLYAAITLFDDNKIVNNFSNMNTMMLTAPLMRGDAVDVWPLEYKAIPASFDYHGQSIGIEDFLNETKTTSLLIVHDGRIVHEDYRMGTQQEDLRVSWSMAKSFLSAVFGIAVHEGKIGSLRDPVDQYVPSLSFSAYAGVAIEDVLHMASGVSFDEDYLDFYSDINKMGRVLAFGKSMDEFANQMHARNRSAGQQWQYVSIDTHVLAMVLRAATGESLTDYLTQRLWRQLGTEGDGYYLVDGTGVAFALGGLNMQTRDYARFGQLFLDDGQWRGEQVIPKAWVYRSTTNSAPGLENASLGYGYQWWLPENASGEFFATGIYGQYIYVNRPAKIVIVKTSAHRNFSGAGVRSKTIELFRNLSNHLGVPPV